MNVRWDAVVTPSAKRACAAVAPAAASADGPVEIRVRLFGMLVRPEVTNPIVLKFARSCALRDVIDELGRRLGREFLRTLVSEDGASFNTCRLFVNGEPVQDMGTTFSSASAAATVEMILFREIEGG